MDRSEEDSFAVVEDPHAFGFSSLHAKSTSITSNNEESVKLLYSKSKVYVHPSTNAADYIPGYISIVEKFPEEYLVAWTPEALITCKDMDAFVKVDMDPENEENARMVMIPPTETAPERYALYALSSSLRDIHSFHVHPPSLRAMYGSITINFKDGQTSAPLWFHDDESRSTVLQKKTQGGKFHERSECNVVRWGGDEFIDRLSQLITITLSPTDSHIYVLGQQFRKQQNGDEKKTFTQDGANMNPNKLSSYDTSIFDSAQMDPMLGSLKEIQWLLLDNFSKVPKFLRGAFSGLTRDNFASYRSRNRYNSAAVRATTDDYDSARIFLAKWAAGIAAQSEQYMPQERRYRNVGVWGHGDGWEEETALGAFEVLNSENDFSIPTHTRTSPVSCSEWASFFDEHGKLSVGEPYVRKRIFCGGLSHDARKEAWLFLTNIYPWDSTAAEREKIVEEKRRFYYDMKSSWIDDLAVQRNAAFSEQKHRIDKDVHRTDRSIPFYAKADMPSSDPSIHTGTNEHLEVLKRILCTYYICNQDLGYVQGMSDLLSPLYAVIRDEALVFAAFEGFMKRTKSNFLIDQTGMHQQLLIMDTLLQFMDPRLYKHLQRSDSGNLFFCFRWFLVWFKRELSWEDTMVMWEVLWSDYLTDQFIFFVALAILDQHRDFIMDYLQSFDDILRYINDLSMTMDVQEILQRAEILYYQFKQRVDAVDAKRQQLRGILSSKERYEEEEERERRKAQESMNRLPNVSDILRRLLVHDDTHESDGEKEKL